jgi:hypothetical protein
MSGSSIDQALIDAVVNTRDAVMSQQTVLTSGAGKAYQSVAQTAAIAVQDAADTLRNISTIATTATGVAMAEYLATSGASPDMEKFLSYTKTMMANATADFGAIGTAASTIANEFKSG